MGNAESAILDKRGNIITKIKWFQFAYPALGGTKNKCTFIITFKQYEDYKKLIHKFDRFDVLSRTDNDDIYLIRDVVISREVGFSDQKNTIITMVGKFKDIEKLVAGQDVREAEDINLCNR